jgi:uncharacterized protein (TIGR02594 family)
MNPATIPAQEIRIVQRLLNAVLVPSPHLAEDGRWGPRSQAALDRILPSRTAQGIAWPAVRMMLGLTPVPFSFVNATAASTGGDEPAWMQIARTELGVHEDSLPGKHEGRILEYHQATTLKATTDETPWCSSFVNWVMVKAGYEGTGSALARSWATWGDALSEGKPGAIVVIKKKGANKDAATGSSTGNHVGFYVSQSTTRLRLLGGNQGDHVKESNFMLAGYDLIAYRWPKGKSNPAA